ncbi:MAG TPA: cytoplasmic protein, partial [Bacillales bacterium]|nr:cytoplasmic protein [Bacillales bacterium]
EDLIINGNGTTAGGTFRGVTVNGRGTVDGKLECQTFECNGMGVFKDNIAAKTVTVNGNAVLKSSLDAEEITINGRARVKGDVTVKDIEISGDTKVMGSLKGEKVVLRGRLSIGGDCEAESFEARGQFTIDGLLNAEEIVLEMHSFGKSKAKEIGGESVTVRYGKPSFLKFLKLFFPAVFEVESIEGDNIELEHTHARVVRGNSVKIGAGCQIGLVEYKEGLECKDDAVVKEERKV